jgi:hypothetical protein
VFFQALLVNHVHTLHGSTIITNITNITNHRVYFCPSARLVRRTHPTSHPTICHTRTISPMHPLRAPPLPRAHDNATYGIHGSAAPNLASTCRVDSRVIQ